MTGAATALVVALLGAVAVMAGLTRPVLQRLPEPAEAVAEGKLAYRDLATPPFVLGCTVLAVVAVAVAWLTLPRAVQPMWWVLAVPVLLLAAVDARTTWLPLPLTRWSWLAMALAALGSAVLGDGLALLLRAGVGAALAGAIYMLVWRVSNGGIGFGDVRFAPLLGAATAAVDWPMLLAALVLGSLAGAAYGVVLLVRRKGRSFAYAPAILSGGYLACGLVALTRAS